jgi:hypothetical protein
MHTACQHCVAVLPRLVHPVQQHDAADGVRAPSPPASSLQRAKEYVESLQLGGQQPFLILEIRRVHLAHETTRGSSGGRRAGGAASARGAGADAAVLPEMPLEPPLQAAAQIYAHGGFLGAAYSMASDPIWAKVGLAETAVIALQDSTALAGASLQESQFPKWAPC